MGDMDYGPILAYIEARIDEVGVPPSIREIADHLGCGRGTVEYHLKRMADKGLLRRAPGVARGLVITGAVMKQETHDA